MDAATADGLSDSDFIAAFEQRILDPFPHRFHLRVAWIHINTLGVDGAIARLSVEIKALAAARGQGTLYHDSVTRAWVYIVAHAAADLGPASTFQSMLRGHPELLDKRLLLKHYRPDTLASPQARAGWVAPDLLALPGAPLGAQGA
jgi:hypothetical protein